MKIWDMIANEDMGYAGKIKIWDMLTSEDMGYAGKLRYGIFCH